MCWVVVAKDREVCSLAHRHLLDIRHQIVRDALGVLPNPPRGMRSDRVEVAQQAHVELTVCLGGVAQDLLVEVLGEAVRVRTPACCESFVDWDAGRLAVHGSRRRKDDVPAASRLHRFHEVERALYVDLVVQQRFGHALPHRLQARKMDDRVDRVRLEHLSEGRLVAYVNLVEGHLASCELLDPSEALEIGVAQVVDDHHVVPLR
mmetsp:Transcript_19809/g.45638  ORF Transcript_19809/g.45638 Transcript_19809/m.45638 type:complete len:205 (-) Transcript_19809:150-764(-)